MVRFIKFWLCLLAIQGALILIHYLELKEKPINEMTLEVQIEKDKIVNATIKNNTISDKNTYEIECCPATKQQNGNKICDHFYCKTILRLQNERASIIHRP